MLLEDYEKFASEIRSEERTHVVWNKYHNLLEIFVQDCVDVPQKYYGNNTLAKARIIFKLQRLFIRNIDQFTFK